ncbi:MAG: hypothetical protein V3R78_02210 [Thermodesulfobacteriota bacterium]|jgi:hypothetical protein
MEFKCIKKCGEACQRRIGIVLFALIALLSVGSLIGVLINI